MNRIKLYAYSRMLLLMINVFHFSMTELSAREKVETSIFTDLEHIQEKKKKISVHKIGTIERTDNY